MRLTAAPYFRLWLVSLVLILGSLAAAIVIGRSSPSHVPSPIGVRLAAAAVVTALTVGAKVLRGPRAAAVTGVAGTIAAIVVLLIVW